MFSTELPSSLGTAPALFSTFNPYPDDQSGVSVCLRLRRFLHRPQQHRHRAGPGQPGGGEGVRLPAVEADRRQEARRRRRSASPVDIHKPASTARVHAVRHATIAAACRWPTGWLAGSLGGAEAIVVGQLAGPGTVKVYSSGSALEGGPEMYLAQPDGAHHRRRPLPRSRASIRSAAASGVSVATTSTTIGADLLVSGVSPADNSAQVRKFQLVRPTARRDHA